MHRRVRTATAESTETLGPDCGVVVTLFTDRRPFHPQRLYEAIDVLLDDVVQTEGRVTA